MSIGWERSQGQLHTVADWVILEPIDEVGQPVPPGQASHSTLLTNLANYVQPLSRYDLGDQITAGSNRCSCGSSLPVIEVQGRCDDSLQVTGVHGQQVTVLAPALTTLLDEDARVFDFQLRQADEQTLRLPLELQGPAAEEALMRCRISLDRFALSQGLAPIHLESEFGHTITRGSSGKARRVVALSSGPSF
jgi:phenylacetate-CoA ligase